jgi:hypothetical protein
MTKAKVDSPGGLAGGHSPRGDTPPTPRLLICERCTRPWWLTNRGRPPLLCPECRYGNLEQEVTNPPLVSLAHQEITVRGLPE